MASAADFNQKYVSTNISPGAPPYDRALIAGFRARLLELDAEEFKLFSYSILTSIFIGAHRPDHVPQLFEEAISGIEDIEIIKSIYYRIRETIMVVWPFVGIPWCVPAGLGLVSVLQKKGIEDIGALTYREPFSGENHYTKGRKIHLKTYEKVNNPEVRELLAIGFPEFRDSTTAIVWGYNIAGATESGLFVERQTELIVATSIITEGASRQARSHIKASLAMGNSTEALKTVVDVATEFAEWTKNPLPHKLDVEALAEDVKNFSS